MKIETALPVIPGIPIPEKKDMKSLVNYALARWALRREVIEERKQLAQLPEALLKDIGVTREAALRESKLDPSLLPQDRLVTLRKQHQQRCN